MQPARSPRLAPLRLLLLAVRTMKLLAEAVGVMIATADLVKRRLICIRRGYHQTLDPGDSCIDCFRLLA